MRAITRTLMLIAFGLIMTVPSYNSGFTAMMPEMHTHMHPQAQSAGDYHVISLVDRETGRIGVQILDRYEEPYYLNAAGIKAEVGPKDGAKTETWLVGEGYSNFGEGSYPYATIYSRSFGWVKDAGEIVIKAHVPLPDNKVYDLTFHNTADERSADTMHSGDYRITNFMNQYTGEFGVKITDDDGRPAMLPKEKLQARITDSNGNTKDVWLHGKGYVDNAGEGNTPFASEYSAYSDSIKGAHSFKLSVNVPLPDKTENTFAFSCMASGMAPAIGQAYGNLRVTNFMNRPAGKIGIQFLDQANQPAYVNIPRIKADITRKDGSTQTVWLKGEGYYAGAGEAAVPFASVFSTDQDWVRDAHDAEVTAWIPGTSYANGETLTFECMARNPLPDHSGMAAMHNDMHEMMHHSH